MQISLASWPWTKRRKKKKEIDCEETGRQIGNEPKLYKSLGDSVQNYVPRYRYGRPHARSFVNVSHRILTVPTLLCVITHTIVSSTWVTKLSRYFDSAFFPQLPLEQESLLRSLALITIYVFVNDFKIHPKRSIRSLIYIQFPNFILTDNKEMIFFNRSNPSL